MPVEVAATANDSVGSQLVYQVKEGLRRSTSLELILNDSAVRLQARIVTLDQDPGNPGNATVYSVVLNWVNPKQPFPFYLTQYTGYCGSTVVRSCAETIVSKISEESDSILHAFSSSVGGR
jgi:hypothetical protein